MNHLVFIKVPVANIAAKKGETEIYINIYEIDAFCEDFEDDSERKRTLVSLRSKPNQPLPVLMTVGDFAEILSGFIVDVTEFDDG